MMQESMESLWRTDVQPDQPFMPKATLLEFAASMSRTPPPSKLGVYSEVIPHESGYYVYRLWEATGICLYVGMIGRRRPRTVAERLREHEAGGYGWWPLVTRTEVAAFACGEDAAAEEKRQLAELRPAYNKSSTGRKIWPGLERARLERRSHERVAELARVWIADFAAEW